MNSKVAITAARFAAAVAVIALAGAARAADPTYGALTPFQPIAEVRLGLFGDDAVHRERQAPMASIEALSSPVALYPTASPWLAPLLAPRLEAGAMINAYGLTSYAFAGLNWRTPVWNRLFGEASFGAAINNSSRDPHDLSRTDLGCPVTFREAAGLGFQITDRVDVVASIEHISHASLCNRLNPGLTSVGFRVGYAF